ncbi:MAG: hypothetical protein GF417_05075 [Candidatus Latescibacteria bacterium]|nr:hypothetical protein [bacterium]MBD3423791.1 hypothetical protein [Candidatus Latescibacterota bacterium]
MYLPNRLNGAEVLVTVKAYPQPSSRYEELVCTAGLLDGSIWTRIYPVPFRFLRNNRKFPKYSWIKLDMIRNGNDFRPESYRPKKGIDEDIRIIKMIGTDNNWALRKKYVLSEVFDSMTELIELAKDRKKNKSLATVKPTEIVDFKIEKSSREWKPKWRELRKQKTLFDGIEERELVPKLPFNYYYHYLTKGDSRTRKAKIEDWEIGALFWNCLKRYSGDEDKANQKVREKYLDEFVSRKDLYFFMGTTKANHIRAKNPFIIIGVFYPPKDVQVKIPFVE